MHLKAAERPEADIVNDEARINAAVKALQESMAPPDSLGLPPLLEKRRQEHLIPNGAFAIQPVYDRIYVYQIGEKDIQANETFGKTSIVMPQTVRESRRAETPRGIVVGAGLQAMDNLRSNGMDVGHVIRFIRNAPWRMPVDWVGTDQIYVFVMRSGDITGSEDLTTALRTGDTRIIFQETTDEYGQKMFKHLYVDKEGRSWNPAQPWLADDM